MKVFYVVSFLPLLHVYNNEITCKSRAARRFGNHKRGMNTGFHRFHRHFSSSKLSQLRRSIYTILGQTFAASFNPSFRAQRTVCVVAPHKQTIV